VLAYSANVESDTVCWLHSTPMNKYVKIRKIGEGSFGNAFLVKDKEKDRQLVMKEINMTKVTILSQWHLDVHALV